MSKTPTAKYRLNYQAPEFKIHTTELHFLLDGQNTEVRNRMDVEAVAGSSTLVLDGDNLQLVGVAIDNQPLTPEEYSVTSQQLILHNVPKRFELVIETLLDPQSNSALEGLYMSAGTYCTQCEAEGFRRITYYLDRPDVLSVFTTTIDAPKTNFPFLLANGNPISEEQKGERHSITWHDPHPKPAYLFALVAGDFDVLEDTFITRDGREVLLQVFVDKGNLNRSAHAMESLKKAMQWDEERFNLIYDLDIYMIVAVDFFNMGAMENKGLNIFNSKYVLADAATATDQDFLNVESVIGHEYFHNWTGNRITCRDWFQLSLKEGLTVFRDQEFSSDLGMRAVNRIQDARIMRTHQFAEDAGPMAHPIRPDRVVEMNNFYTVTVYNKGAEVIRMLHTLLGETKFQKGMQLYVERHDGQAVTCEDFVAAMEDANELNLKQFRNWYAQAGTPKVTVTEHYEPQAQRYSLTLQQHTPATPGQPEKHPFHIPVRVEFVSEQGTLLPITMQESKLHSAKHLLELREVEQHFVFENVAQRPVPGVLADFSAPVRLHMPRNESDSLAIIAGSEDAYLRWDTVQQLYLQALHTAINDNQPVVLSAALVNVLENELLHTKNPALTALLLQIPNEEALSQEFSVIPVAAVAKATAELRLALAEALQSALFTVWRKVDLTTNVLSSAAISERMLANTALSYLAHLHSNVLPADKLDKAIAESISEGLYAQFSVQNNMTLQFGALQAAVHANHPIANTLLERFAQQWQGNTLVMDKWLAVQSTAPISGTVANIQALTQHSAFNWGNPNRIYALLASFTHNFAQLHCESGLGYQFIGQAITRLNSVNPQVASRLLSPLLIWRKLPSRHRQLLRAELENLSKLENLAPDLYEKVNQTLTEN